MIKVKVYDKIKDRKLISLNIIWLGIQQTKRKPEAVYK